VSWVFGADKRYFDREFKYEAIRSMDECKRSVLDITKDLDLHLKVPEVVRKGNSIRPA